MKRFKITSSQKVLRGKQYGRHRRSHKSKRRIRTFAKNVEVTGREATIIKQLI